MADRTNAPQGIIPFGTQIRPTPTSRGVRKLLHRHPASDAKGFKDESAYVHCRTCGFICKRGRDNACPFCETAVYWKPVR